MCFDALFYSLNTFCWFGKIHTHETNQINVAPELKLCGLVEGSSNLCEGDLPFLRRAEIDLQEPLHVPPWLLPLNLVYNRGFRSGESNEFLPAAQDVDGVRTASALAIVFTKTVLTITASRMKA